MSAALERRYGRLLRLYPAGYRRAHGDEVLDTLLAAAEDGRMRPPWRETTALLAGALRARAGRDRRWSVRDTWLTAVRAAALMMVAHGLAGILVEGGLRLAHGGPVLWAPLVPAVLDLVPLVLGVVVLIALRRAGRRLPPPTGLLRWAPVVPAVLAVADQVFSQAFPAVSGILQRGLLVAVCLGALLWLAVDERVAMALGLLLSTSPLIHVALMATEGVGNPVLAAVSLAVSAAGPVILLLASGATARRQAEI